MKYFFVLIIFLFSTLYSDDFTYDTDLKIPVKILNSFSFKLAGKEATLRAVLDKAKRVHLLMKYKGVEKAILKHGFENISLSDKKSEAAYSAIEKFQLKDGQTVPIVIAQYNTTQTQLIYTFLVFDAKHIFNPHKAIIYNEYRAVGKHENFLLNKRPEFAAKGDSGRHNDGKTIASGVQIKLETKNGVEHSFKKLYYWVWSKNKLQKVQEAWKKGE